MVQIQLEVHCEIAPWTKNQHMHINLPVYRLYCNDDLLVERTWLWDNSTYINEELYLNLDNGINQIRIEPILFDQHQANFTLGNLHFPSNIQINEKTQHSIKFTIT